VTYTLRNGYSVRTTKVEDGTEFVTRNASGETISTVRLDFLNARALVLDLTRKAV
jgi:hypothetical protein